MVNPYQIYVEIYHFHQVQSFSKSFMIVIGNIFQTSFQYIQSEWAQTSPFLGWWLKEFSLLKATLIAKLWNKKPCSQFTKCWVKLRFTLYNNLIVKLSQSVNMSFTQHFAAISQVFSHFMHICSFQQCQYCEIGNVSIGFSKSRMPKILSNHESKTIVENYKYA